MWTPSETIHGALSEMRSNIERFGATRPGNKTCRERQEGM